MCRDAMLPLYVLLVILCIGAIWKPELQAIEDLRSAALIAHIMRVGNGVVDAVVDAAVVAGSAEGAADEAAVSKVDKGAGGLLDAGGVKVVDVIGRRKGLWKRGQQSVSQVGAR